MAIRGTTSRGFFFQDPSQSDTIFNRYAWLSSNLLAAMSNKHLSSDDFKESKIDRFTAEVTALQASMHLALTQHCVDCENTSSHQTNNILNSVLYSAFRHQNTRAIAEEVHETPRSPSHPNYRADRAALNNSGNDLGALCTPDVPPAADYSGRWKLSAVGRHQMDRINSILGP